MARIARVIVPGVPHHVVQRGVRSIPIFDNDDDRQLYLRLLKEHAAVHSVMFHAWCLMTNHVHFVAVPRHEKSLAKTFGEAHKIYTREFNKRHRVTGYLFQGRFGSCPLDDRHLYEAVRYVELNPVRAGIVQRAEQYPWSSAAYHLAKRKTDALVTSAPPSRNNRDITSLFAVLGEVECCVPSYSDSLVTDALPSLYVEDWASYLGEGTGEAMVKALEKHLNTGRPIGNDDFVRSLGSRVDRDLVPKKRGWPKGRERK